MDPPVRNPGSDQGSNSEVAQLLTLPVGGRLITFKHFWRLHVKDHWVSQVIEDGYKIDFSELPHFEGVKETKLAQKSLLVLLQEVDELLQKQAIEPVPPQEEPRGFYSTFFVVPKKTGDLRPILNLIQLNVFVKKERFKMETLQSVLNAVQPADWLAALDLKDAYLHILINQKDRKFLRFKVAGKAFQFRVLPFGLSSSPRVFTKVLAPIAAIIREKGIHVYPYLDDILIRSPSRDKLITDIACVKQTLLEAGFIINLKKSHLVPSQNLIFLGAHIRSDKACVQLPVEKHATLLDLIAQFRVGEPQPARKFLSLLGLMGYMIPMVKFCRLFRRPIQLYLFQYWLGKRRNWDELVPVLPSLLGHLQWWVDPQNVFQGCPLVRPEPEQVVTTDASTLRGWGGHMGNMEVQGCWEPHFRAYHINVLELEAVSRSLRHFQKFLEGKVVLVRSDSSTVVSYLNKEGGTRSRTLCERTIQLLLWAKDNKISIRAEFVPGKSNSRADKLSREFVSQLEWRLKPQVVQQVFNLLGFPWIDLFASQENAQLPVYCSRTPEEGAYQVDCMSMTWQGLFGYAFPPLCLIPPVLQKVVRFRATIILIAPMWSRRSWYSTLLELLADMPLVLPTPPDLLSQQEGKLHHPNPEKLNLLAWRVSGVASEREAFRRMLSEHSSDPSAPLRPGCMTNCGRYLVVGALPEGYVLAKRL